MGLKQSCLPGGDEKETRYAFNSHELALIKQIFSEISSFKPKSASRGTVSKKGLEHKFPENPDFALKLHKWMKANSDSGMVNFDTYARILEILTKESSHYKLARGFANLERIEVVALVSLEKYSMNRDEAYLLKITYLQALRIIKEILNIFQSKNDPSGIKSDDIAARAVTDQMFESNQDTYDFAQFIYKLKDRMRFANKMLSTYFTGKFIDSSYNKYLHLPLLDNPSTILNDQLLALFWLNNDSFQKTEKLNLLYSMSTHGSSFNRLAHAISGYNAPTLFILKNVERKSVGGQGDTDYSGTQTSVFGGFATNGWREELAYQGNGEGFVFSLLPKYKQFQAYNGDGGQNYVYFNSRKIANSKFKVGLGFGGRDFNNFRLWIDDDIEADSYATPDDATYEKGYLVRPDIVKFNIQQLEVWGLGGEQALINQNQFRALEAEQLEKARKVDKKAMLQNSFDREILFEKTFAAANNRRGSDA